MNHGDDWRHFQKRFPFLLASIRRRILKK
jgi:hypothetical protein